MVAVALRHAEDGLIKSSQLLVVPVAAVLSYVFSGLVRGYSLKNAVLDIPNERSSHTRPTPRGGGVGLLAALSLAFIAGARLPFLDWRLLAAFAGVVLTAMVGWMDDRRTLGVQLRLAVQLVAGATLLPLALLPAPVPTWLGLAAALLWLFLAVSAINVVNFMDGIDGLIGLQAVVFGAHVALEGSANGVAGVMGFALIGAAAGFLIWNWSPARIFLGDVGSGSLGMLFVLEGLLLIREGSAGLVTAFLPLYPLFLDATVTLWRRARRGEAVTQAHRSHLYQRLANSGWGHARVSMFYAGVAVVGLAVAQAADAEVGRFLIVAYLLLVPVAGLRIDRAYPSNPLLQGICAE